MKPLTLQKHRDKYWHRYTNFSFAASFNTALIVATEIPRAALAMPLAFIRQDNSYFLAGVLSPTSGQNIYVAPDGRWLGGYVPSSLRSYPFKLIMDSDGKEPVLCVDEDSGLIQSDQTKGTPIFEDSGELSEPVQKVLHFLRQFEQNRVITKQALSYLEQADVFTKWNLKVMVNGEERSSVGLYRIDETRLSQLSDPMFLQLRNTGALKVAYAQLLSMGNIMKLSNLAKMHKKFTSTSSAASFSIENDDMFRFGK